MHPRVTILDHDEECGSYTYAVYVKCACPCIHCTHGECWRCHADD